MPGWITNALKDASLDLSKAGGYSFEKTETLLDQLDRNVRDARTAIAAAKDSDCDVTWSLTMGPLRSDRRRAMGLVLLRHRRAGFRRCPFGRPGMPA